MEQEAEFVIDINLSLQNDLSADEINEMVDLLENDPRKFWNNYGDYFADKISVNVMRSFPSQVFENIHVHIQ